MPDKTPAPQASGGVPSVNVRWLGYLGLVLGFGAVALTVDSGSVSVLGFSFPISVPLIAAIAFAGGILGGRFGPRPGAL
ncbi:hypothetical protein [Demequina lignilytica]|uniref:Uncharacterized protein n=1 Tax=Demequina lignilytica TaxID=3051663 RepID=A0AAW7M9B9_9MICO|nr:MULTISPECIES: hypothetical protein [unclassified Demequina]MDN4478587.1 hypothetical protein [Demequina sp. SYSU T00039-1]MDN4483853.1 hypothetical protein [Demequina sp. SYSU T0a273]MDN4488565.1 hypothetical protein [Demequina sp. SYSU T00039]MDN4491572.1 hypothetical protein [Demequina sp. SYSU T00068]